MLFPNGSANKIRIFSRSFKGTCSLNCVKWELLLGSRWKTVYALCMSTDEFYLQFFSNGGNAEKCADWVASKTDK